MDATTPIWCLLSAKYCRHGLLTQDQLEIGNGDLTYDEAKTHFTAWALMKAPLLIGTNVSYTCMALTPLCIELAC